MWNFARRNKRSVRFHPEHVEPQSADSGKSGQYQFVAGDDPVTGHALPSQYQRQYHITPCINFCRFCINNSVISPSRALGARLFFLHCRWPRPPVVGMHHKSGGFRSLPSGIRMSCAPILTLPNTSSAFLASRSPFRFTNLPIFPRTPTFPCASPIRKIPARSEGIGSVSTTTTRDGQRVLQ
jgi:hypothetical protein